MRSPLRAQSPRLLLLSISAVVGVIALVSIMASGGTSHQNSAHLVRHQQPLPQPVPQSPLAETQTPAITDTAAATSAAPSLARMVGQQLMVRMNGTSADGSLLLRIRHGEVGGVILYADNIVSPEQTRALVRQLQDAATAGSNPPLLISVDQEGGQVKRLGWASPQTSAQEMGAAGPATASRQGFQAGRDLRSVGINVDLAPDADVAHSPGVFIWRQQRSFGMDSNVVSASAGAFTVGLQRAGVAATAKHFPGLGGALSDTDYALQVLRSEQRDLAPFAHMISTDHVAEIMVSTGIFPNLDPSRTPAAMSRPIVTDLLRGRLGFDGVIITDDLERPTGSTTATAVQRAAAAGANVILVSSTESGGAEGYRALLAAARGRQVDPAQIADSYQRVLELKTKYAG